MTAVVELLSLWIALQPSDPTTASVDPDPPKTETSARAEPETPADPENADALQSSGPEDASSELEQPPRDESESEAPTDDGALVDPERAPESSAAPTHPDSNHETVDDPADERPTEPTNDPPADEAPNKSRKKKLSWSLGGRVMAGWEAQRRRPASEAQGEDGWEQGPFLQQARAKLRLDYDEVFGIRLSAELSDALDIPDFDRIPYLRNAYAKVRFHDAVRLRVGHFKRPFSRLELRSPGKLAIRGRGLANDTIIEDLNYGDRSTGAMLWGRIRPARTRWYLGAFAPALRTAGIDVVGRARVDPIEWLSVGASGGYKRIEVQGRATDAASAGADVRVALAGFSLLGDLVLGQDYEAEGQPWSLGLVGIARYDLDLPKKLVLQPVVSTEWADTNVEVSDNDAIRTVIGVNLRWRKRFRVMPQVELVRPHGVIDNPWVNEDTYYVVLSMEL